MPNVLPIELQKRVIFHLCEGTSIRSTERQTGVHRDTIMRLGLRVGAACERLMDESMRELPCKQVQCDEIWGYVGKKQGHLSEEEKGNGQIGDCWTYVALCRDTKLVPTYCIGKRDYPHTYQFATDIASRMANRIQISTDGMNAYAKVFEDVFAAEEYDYGQVVKVMASDWKPKAERKFERKYSPGYVSSLSYQVIAGEPDKKMICTSHVERHNRTMRMHIRRLTRLTDGFSKKFANMKAAIALYFAYYNFVKLHSSIRMTPAMAAKITSRFWTIDDLLALKPV